jgi:hypothetical protein
MNDEKSNMSDLLEGIPYQPIDDNEDKKHWEEIALPLVRKVFEDIKSGKIKSE